MSRAELHARMQVHRATIQVLREQGLTHTEIALRLGISRPAVSKLLKRIEEAK